MPKVRVFDLLCTLSLSMLLLLHAAKQPTSESQANRFQEEQREAFVLSSNERIYFFFS